ncbi:DUF6879 family protein [Cryptosporangium arvum]|uniref:DUF6879 domain-containing protein n=1 Tax=Cryptosporangium arvum DSM 44712 TaxID=927661 RepID=A0A010ZTI3_9ACTN|nr:DUF6879 family protein [Cryptosporangium arvum]EXG82014.1 hypothetical protein CryarDRAFT_3145 [Cryptosporangium arvum DSM 44712]
MRDLLNHAHGTQLTSAEYRADFGDRFWNAGPDGFWKIERRQTFQEPRDESWRAFNTGDWPTALRLIEEQRPDLEAEGRRLAEENIDAFRVRVVELPLTPYLAWELHLLRLVAETADQVRVIGPETAQPFEPLPELVLLGADVTYEVLYDDEGIAAGAARYIDRELTAACRQSLRQMFATGEDIQTFFEREVAPLPPPVG